MKGNIIIALIVVILIMVVFFIFIQRKDVGSWQEGGQEIGTIDCGTFTSEITAPEIPDCIVNSIRDCTIAKGEIKDPKKSGGISRGISIEVKGKRGGECETRVSISEDSGKYDATCLIPPSADPRTVIFGENFERYCTGALVDVISALMGAFNPSAVIAPGKTGFGKMIPIEFACEVGAGATDTFTLSLANAAGVKITELSMTIGTSTIKCTPSTVEAGGISICKLTNVDCGTDSAGERYEVNPAILYTPATGSEVTEEGTVFGRAK